MESNQEERDILFHNLSNSTEKTDSWKTQIIRMVNQDKTVAGLS